MALIILTLVYFLLWGLFLTLTDKGYFNDKQFKMYFLILFIIGLFLLGQIDNYCNTLNGY